MKYVPRKVYIKKDGDYVELSYQDFCRRRQADQSYMDKLFIPVQGCLLEVVREQYTDFYRDTVFHDGGADFQRCESSKRKPSWKRRRRI